MQETISLFTTFFLPESIERRKELLFCLNQNINNKFIKNIFLLLDGNNEILIKETISQNVSTNKVQFINVNRVPTYGDWIQCSKQNFEDLADVSVFCNADIYTDETITNLSEYITTADSIVCLSRHDDKEEGILPHPNPHWSQDLWAISKENILSIESIFFLDELKITTTGVYRCDNKLAYLFAMRGWVIYNPYLIVKCYHLQRSLERNYDRFATSIVGGLCFPSPTSDPSVPSELDISIMPVKVGKITKCDINKYLQKNLFPELEPQKPVETVKDFKPEYVWPSKAFPFREYFTSDKLKVFIIENIIHNYEWLNAYKDKITDNHFFFVILGWNHSDYLFQRSLEMLNLLKLNKNNFFFLCNSQQEEERMNQYGLRGDLINHNAYLDENLYSIVSLEKKYNAIKIARRAKWKRHHLASKVPNLALIAGGNRHGNTGEILLPPHVYNNEKQLTTLEVIEKINSSCVGLCLSKEEGACYASSEYLLCGIPVVSTASQGGRDFWYDSYNSIICEDTEESVAEAVNFFLNNKRDPETIRSNHIALAKQQRVKFIKVLQEVFNQHEVKLNATTYYNNNFMNKMRTSHVPKFNEIF